MVRAGRGFYKHAYNMAKGKNPTYIGNAKWMGRDVIAKITPHADMKTATVRISQKYVKNGQNILSTFEGEAKDFKLRQTADGRVEIDYVGTFIKVNGEKTTRTIVNTPLRYTGTSRMEVGFDSLMGQLRMNGVPQSQVQEFVNIWESLTDKQKIDFYARYHNDSIVTTYGSDAINESKMEVTTATYAEVIERCLKDAYKSEPM